MKNRTNNCEWNNAIRLKKDSCPSVFKAEDRVVVSFFRSASLAFFVYTRENLRVDQLSSTALGNKWREKWTGAQVQFVISRGEQNSKIEEPNSRITNASVYRGKEWWIMLRCHQQQQWQYEKSTFDPRHRSIRVGDETMAGSDHRRRRSHPRMWHVVRHGSFLFATLSCDSSGDCQDRRQVDVRRQFD